MISASKIPFFYKVESSFLLCRREVVAAGGDLHELPLSADYDPMFSIQIQKVMTFLSHNV